VYLRYYRSVRKRIVDTSWPIVGGLLRQRKSFVYTWKSARASTRIGAPKPAKRYSFSTLDRSK
jgi:hypothetical protein